MEKRKIHLVVLSPVQKLFDGEVSWVELPGEQGRFQVLFNHAALISSLTAGKIMYGLDDNTGREGCEIIDIEGGFVEVGNNTVSVCVETV